MSTKHREYVINNMGCDTSKVSLLAAAGEDIPDPYGEPYEAYAASSDWIVKRVERVLAATSNRVWKDHQPSGITKFALQSIGWENAPAWLALGSLPLMHGMACEFRMGDLMNERESPCETHARAQINLSPKSSFQPCDAEARA